MALLLTGSALPLSLHGQTTTSGAQQPTFRSTTALVEVDVTVLDKQGRFVPGMLAEDLELFEDGKPQKIQQFYMVAHDPTKGVINLAASRSEAEERARRFFVFMFDESHLSTESLMRAKAGAEDFIRHQMLPGDMAGVFANGQMNKSRMTDDKIELLAAIRSASPAIDNRQALLAPFREFPGIPSENDALRITEGARELLDRLGAKACTDDPFQCQLQGGVQQVENLMQQKARLYVRSARVMTDTALQNIQYVSANLTRLLGRKTLVLMTEGFFTQETRPQIQTLAAQAARGGTTIYTIDGRGLVNTMSRNPDATMASMARSTAFDDGDEGPSILTAGTGGIMVHGIDDIGRAIGMVANDTSSYYVIGYQPENGVMDGKFRSIQVKSRAQGVNIRARKGYAAIDLPPQEFVRRAVAFGQR
ncbi:MAG: VWA domain-containing protein [Acidobacteriota bacterium]